MYEYGIWHDALRNIEPECATLRQAGLHPADLRRIELGLTLRLDYAPKLPLTDVWLLLLGYDFPDIDQIPLAVRQRAQFLLWTYRSRYRWQHDWEDYATHRALGAWRSFGVKGKELGQPQIALPFTQQRLAAYRQALHQPLIWKQQDVRWAIAASKAYRWELRHSGRSQWATITFPQFPNVDLPCHSSEHSEHLLPPALSPTLPPALSPALPSEQQRSPLTIPWQELLDTAHWMDQQEQQHTVAAGMHSGNWAQRLQKVDFRAITPDGSFTPTAELILQGTTHWIGRVGAGKSTLMQVLAVWCARRGQRVTLVLGDTMAVLDWAAQFVQLGLRAAPVLGASQRDRHAQRFDTRERRQGSFRPATIANQWLSMGCPVDTWRDQPEEVLPYHDYPCQRLQEVTDDRLAPNARLALHTCPAWGQCPTHQAARDLVNAEIWVATAPALLYGQCPAPLSDRRMRYWEQMWRSSTLVMVDECDRAQVQLDLQFAPTERLESPDKTGLLTRLQDRLGPMPGRSSLLTRTTTHWAEAWDTLHLTITCLYGLLRHDQDRAAIAQWSHQGEYFTAWSVFNTVAQTWIKNLPTDPERLERPSTREKRQAKRQAKWWQHPLYDYLNYVFGRFLDDPNPQLDALAIANSPAIKSSESPATTTLPRSGLRIPSRKLQAAVTQLAIYAQMWTTADSDHQIRPALQTWLDQQKDIVIAALQSQGMAQTATHAACKDHPGELPKNLAHLESLRTLPAASSALATMLAFGLVVARLLRSLNLIIRDWQSVADVLGLDLEASGLFQRPPRELQPLVPVSPQGNVLALRLTKVEVPDGNPAGEFHLDFFKCLGVGRALLTQFERLYGPARSPQVPRPNGDGFEADESTDPPPSAPHLLLLSGTSWAPDSGSYHVAVPVTALLSGRGPAAVQIETSQIETSQAHGSSAAAARVSASQFRFDPCHDSAGQPLRVSGMGDRDRRREALRQLTLVLGQKRSDGRSLLERDRAAIPDPKRQRILLVVGSYADAQLVGEILREPQTLGKQAVRVLIPDDGENPNGVGEGTVLQRGAVAEFAATEAWVLVAPALAIERGHNILNEDQAAAIGCVQILVRPHPRPQDLGAAVQLLNRWALDLSDRLATSSSSASSSESPTLASCGLQFRREAENLWRSLLQTPTAFSTLRDGPLRERSSLVWGVIVLLVQVMGRTIRGDVPTTMVFRDAAFMPETAHGQRDTSETSVLLAAQALLAPYCAPLGAVQTAALSSDQRRDRAIAQALYQPFYDGLCQILTTTGHPLQGHDTPPSTHSSKDKAKRSKQSKT